ncbi:hypothetical protein ACWDRR_13320 [Kitasatospora sp. NPDC003701]
MSVHRILISRALLVLGPAALRGLLRRLGRRRAAAEDRHPAAGHPGRGGGRARHCADRSGPVQLRGHGRGRDRGRPAPRRCHLAGPGAVRH